MIDGAALQAAADRACSRIAPNWPLDRFIAVNPFWPRTDTPITTVATELSAVPERDEVTPFFVVGG